MLSRNAESLYWLTRYIERSYNVACLIESAYRLSNMPRKNNDGHEWESALKTAGTEILYNQFHKEKTKEDIIHFLLFSKDNPNSLNESILKARFNAKALRPIITSTMVEAMNTIALDLKKAIPKQYNARAVMKIIEIVKEFCLRFEGLAHHTLLRHDGYSFFSLGLYLERADFTPRILDIKYHVLLPKGEAVGGSVDYFQWSAILRTLASLTNYHRVYREAIRPWNVADFVLFYETMPRSCNYCYQQIITHLDHLAKLYGHQGAAQEKARQIHSQMRRTNINSVFQEGLHEYLNALIAQNAALNNTITEQYFK